MKIQNLQCDEIGGQEAIEIAEALKINSVWTKLNLQVRFIYSRVYNKVKMKVFGKFHRAMKLEAKKQLKLQKH